MVVYPLTLIFRVRGRSGNLPAGRQARRSSKTRFCIKRICIGKICLYTKAWWRSGNAAVCKTAMRGFDSRPRLKKFPIREIFYVGEQHLRAVRRESKSGAMSDLSVTKQDGRAGPARKYDSILLVGDSCRYNLCRGRELNPHAIASRGF